MFKYGYLIIAIVIGVVAIYFLYVSISGQNTQKRSVIGWFTWGPFWPSINKYAKERGGLSKREKIGWVVVGLLIILGILIDLLFPIK